jgi:hypothetical protein
VANKTDVVLSTCIYQRTGSTCPSIPPHSSNTRCRRKKTAKLLRYSFWRHKPGKNNSFINVKKFRTTHVTGSSQLFTKYSKKKTKLAPLLRDEKIPSRKFLLRSLVAPLVGYGNLEYWTYVQLFKNCCEGFDDGVTPLYTFFVCLNTMQYFRSHLSKMYFMQHFKHVKPCLSTP